MATGDITAVAVRETGWDVDLTVEGWAGDQGDIAYDFALDADSEPTAATPYLDFTDEGYTPAGAVTTVSRRVYLTKAVRRPYPNEASLDETDSGADLVVRVSLSDWVDDSATSVTLTAPAAWATNSGASAGDSAATSGLSGTNASTLAPPASVTQWDGVAGVRSGERVKADFAVAVDAYHMHGVAAVKFTATGVTSGHVETATVSVRTALRRDAIAGSGKWYSAYQATIPVAGFAQGETVDVDYEVFPAIGASAAVLSTSGNTAADDEVAGQNTASLIVDKDNLLDVFAYVDPVSGDDGTGVVSGTAATAAAAPFATLKAAMDDPGNANVVRLEAGTHRLPSAFGTKDLAEWRVVEPAPGEDASTAIVEYNGRTFLRNRRVWFKGVGLTQNGTNGYIQGGSAVAFSRYKWCVRNITTTAAVGVGYRSSGCYIEESTWGGNAAFDNDANNRNPYVIDGITAENLGTSRPDRFVACDVDSVGLKNPRYVGRSDTNRIYANNSVGDDGSATPSLQIADTGDATNIAVTGNIFEWSGPGGGGEMIGISRDGTAHDTRHIIIWNNAFVGERCNWFYNDAGSDVSLHTHCSVRGNALSNHNIKADLFGTPNGARIGNWGPLHGCGIRGNLYERSAGATFTPEFAGLGTRYLNAPVTGTDSLFGFVDNGGTEGGDGSGDGDYTPDADSPLLTVPVPAPRAAFDLFGRARTASVIGAVMPAPSGSGSARTRRHDHRFRRPV
ncbi:MAG: hypothetical protein AAF532_13975 [Planctomycetota bacterium]